MMLSRERIENMTRRLAVCLTCLSAPALSAQESEATRLLSAWTTEFERDIVQVTEGVYAAVGYGGSVFTMVVGDDGVIMVDTGGSPRSSAQAREALRGISPLPVRAIIYTHGHADHTNGASAFVDEGSRPDVWAHARFGVELRTLREKGLRVNRLRLARQFGIHLPPEKRINNGIGPAIYPDPDVVAVPPNRTFEERTTLDVAGVRLELVANPGETQDEIYVWLPEKKVIFAGDNFYKGWPNLYAIRGTPYRDVWQWGHAVDALLRERPEYLVGGHTRPILGKDAVTQALTDYRDAIHFVFDKTVEGMNEGLTPDELVQHVQLPPHLADQPFLQPYFGHVPWAVRSIFTGYLGWFDGNPTNLLPLGPRAEAERMVALAGGRDRLLERAREALSSGDDQWAAQLSDYLLALDKSAVAPKEIKARALESLGERTLPASGRNYYLTAAQELREEIQGH